VNPPNRIGQKLTLFHGLSHSVLALGISSRYKGLMRVLMLLSQTEITGAEVHAVKLGEWLKSQGHQVFIMSDTLTVATDLAYHPRKIHPKGFWHRLSNILSIRKFIRENQIDLIHAHSRAAVRVGFWSALTSTAALVSTVHGRQHFSPSKRIFNLYGQHIIAVCRNIQQHLLKDFGLKKDHVTVIGNPVDSSRLSLIEEILSSAPIAVVGRTSGPKGEQTKNLILSVFPELLKTHPQLKIHLLGGPMSNFGESVLNQIQELNQLYPGCLSHRESSDLDGDLTNYRLIFAAGRVAITGLLRGIPVWAIGEASSLGLVTEENFSLFCESNFGDIGLDAGGPKFSADSALKELNLILSKNPAQRSVRSQLREKALEHFDFSAVAAKIETVYKAAVLYKNHRSGIPVLMYHMVTPTKIDTRHQIFVTREKFDQQLASFRRWGHQSITFQDLEDFTCGRRPWSKFPAKPFMITFDDGYQNNLTEALPLLKKHGFKAVIYLLANLSVTGNDWDCGEIPRQPLLNAPERKALFESGFFEIGSHGLTHHPLTAMPAPAALQQLKESKQILEKEFGQPILSYAFTYGLRTDELAEQAFNCGYHYIVNTDQGGLHLATPLTSIFRTTVFPQDAGAKLWRKVQPWYRRYFLWTRKH
jgi:peptidoglycan/xylan/chitin deacetylase (PgdA/CDA1 family)/glycosyltransferase involved in cell wall biosynthesis